MAAGRLYEFGEFRLDSTERLLFRCDKHVPLPPKAVDMLVLLVERRGHIVDKDTLLKEIWPDTFVEEGNLAQNISVLRKILTGGHDGKELIETIPKRGYRFVASVHEVTPAPAATTSVAGAVSAPSQQPARRKWVFTAVAVGAVVLFTTAVALWFTFGRPVLSFVSRDWVLVADFENQTGEARFDKALLTAFTVSLEQSQHANVFPRARLGPVLQRMSKTGDPRIDEVLGREICLRENLRGLITCSITRTGQEYAISARLVDPKTGNPVRSYLERAFSEDNILDALDTIAGKIRRDLGESLYSIERTSRPLPQVTTRSLEALQKYSDAVALWNQRKHDEAVLLYEAALKLDPDFAMAQAGLGSVYYSHVYSDLAKGREHYEKALQLSERTTERERELIQANYHDDLGHVDQAIELYRRYLKSYPDDSQARFNLAYLFMKSRHLEEAIEGFREVLRVDSKNANAAVDLATCYVILGRYTEALPYYSNAFALQPSWIRWSNLNHEYGFALVGAGQPAKAREVFGLAVADQDNRERGLRSMALLDLYEGRYQDARPLLQEAIAVCRSKNNLLPEARNHFYLAILLEGTGDSHGELHELGQTEKTLAKLQLAEVYRSRVGAAYARAGAVDQAAQLLSIVKSKADLSDQSLLSEVHRFEGELELARGNSQRAVELLQLADRESRTGLTLESLAFAYQKTGDTDHAIAAYEVLLGMNDGAWLGWEPQQSWIRAHYELARLYFSRGEKEKAKKSLEVLLVQWKNADPDLPLFKDALRLQGEFSK